MKPSRSGDLAKVLVSTVSRRQAIKGLVTTVTIGGVLGLECNTAFAANPPKLTITIETGSDDLRQTSQAVAYVILERNNRISQINMPLNNGAQWSNGSVHTPPPFSLVSGLTPAPGPFISDIKEFGISFFSGQSGPFDTGDNWNMNKILVSYSGDNVSKTTLLFMSGSPLKRFVSDHDDWHVTFF